MTFTADQVRQELRLRREQYHRELRKRPRMRLYDRNWEFICELYGEITASFDEKLNDTGQGQVKIFATHPLKDWLLGLEKNEKNEFFEEESDLHIVVDFPKKRWSGKLNTLEYESDDKGFEYITLNFLSEYEHLKKIVCYSNPWLPPEFQWPKLYIWAGPSISGIKTIIFLNLMRRFLPFFWNLPENIFDPGTWLRNFNPNEWPIVVVPHNFFLDKSPWSIITTRFGMLHDVVAPTLADAKLRVVVKRWVPGDPQPAPTHMWLTRPTLLIDVDEVSGVSGPTGTVIDGLLKTTSNFIYDMKLGKAEEYFSVNSPDPDPPEYNTPGFFGTVNTHPWVSWRNGMRTGLTGIQNFNMTMHKCLAFSVVTGGKSPGYVNMGIKLLLNGVLGYLGILFGNPALGLGIFDSQVEDVVLAFHKVSHVTRQVRMGNNAYGEHWENDNGTGFSMSALQAIRSGFWNTRAYTSFKVTVTNGAPYWVGVHFDLGDRVSAEIGDTGRLYVDNVFSLKVEWTRTQDPMWEIGIGNGEAEEPPGSVLARQIEQIKAVVQDLTASA